MNKKVVVFCLLLLPISSIGQNIQNCRCIDSLKQINHLDSLKIRFGKNKTIPNHLLISSLLALAYFPELQSQRIRFKETGIKTTLNARPSILSLFRFNKSKRKYIIRVNNKTNEEIVSVYRVPFNAQIGLLGHEFAHIVDYQQKNFFGVIKRAFSYLSEKSKKKFEHEIDNLTIKSGLGWQLYDWSYYILNQSNATEEYKQFKREIYLTPEQILTAMQKSGFTIGSN